ncbi:MAG: LiaF transmembrane domain-containing protein [Bacteroidota bacterium]
MQHSRFSWFGAGLVTVGITLLLNRMDILSLHWWTGLWCILAALGVKLVVDGFEKHSRGRIFGGTMLFLNGLYQILGDIDVVEFRSYYFFPVLILILGFSFLMTYISSLKAWHLLVPAILLSGFGSLLLLTEFGFLYRWEVLSLVKDYWPIGLILFGFSLLLTRRTA